LDARAQEYVRQGRPPGSRNKRDAEIWKRLEDRGDKDPADFLSSIVTNNEEPIELRVQAANMLMPYKYAKRGAIPQPQEPRFITIEIRITKATTVTQGRENLQLISELRSDGRIDVEYADTLFAEHTKILDALIEEKKLQNDGKGSEPQTIRIVGGLPVAPGHEGVIMPNQNAYVINGHHGPVIDHQPEQPAIESTPAVAPEPTGVSP
jgi:hypothetical protein